MKQAFFLDRDGVINVEVDYLSDPDKAELIPGVPEALREIHAHGFLAIVVTNQSGVARGMYTQNEVNAVHRRIDELLAAAGAKVDGWYFCPHHPKHTGPCDCRKPAPGMLLQAAKDFNIDLSQSWMVGDGRHDISAGKAAGCKTAYISKYRENEYYADLVVTSILEFVQRVI